MREAKRDKPMFKVGDRIRANSASYIFPFWVVGVVESFTRSTYRISTEDGSTITVHHKDATLVAEEKPVGVDFKKPVTTRDGRPVRILCTDRKSERSVIALVESKAGDSCWSYLPSGLYSKDSETPHDLVNPPVKKYINLFPRDCSSSYFDSREEAEASGKASKNAGYIKTIEVEL